MPVIASAPPPIAMRIMPGRQRRPRRQWISNRSEPHGECGNRGKIEERRWLSRPIPWTARVLYSVQHCEYGQHESADEGS